MNESAIQELSIYEIDHVDGGSAVGDTIAAVGQAAQAVVNAAYDAGYKLGHAVRGLFE